MMKIIQKQNFQNPGDVTEFCNKRLNMMERGEDEVNVEDKDANHEDITDSNNMEEEKDDDGLHEFTSKDEKSTSQVLGKNMEEEDE